MRVFADESGMNRRKITLPGDGVGGGRRATVRAARVELTLYLRLMLIQQRVPGRAAAHRTSRSEPPADEVSTSSARGRTVTGPANADTAVAGRATAELATAE